MGCNQVCPYNTLTGCKVKEHNGICPLSNSVTAKPMTNADRIRAMSDEELAAWMLNGISTNPCDYCEYNNGYCDGSPCSGKADADTIIAWLQQPAEEVEHE